MRRAILIPCLFITSATKLSERGSPGFSFLIISATLAFTLLVDIAPCSSLLSVPLKKYFSSNIPCPVSMYLSVVTLLIVDS